jgi:filamentous hemagglutinin family protein
MRIKFKQILVLTSLLVPATLYGNPAGEAVVAGKVSFDRITPGVLSIRQDTDRAIINWQDFSIGAGDLTRFIQPGPNSAALNRVLGGNPSAIYGTLQANGQVILLNPAGILVGSGGRVDTRGFIASTLNLSDESFLNRAKSNLGLRDDSTAGHPSDTLSPSDGERAGVRGTLKFSGDSSASVRNAGTIVGGNVYLIARSVDNSGSISGGNVGLVGASEVILGDAGQGVAVLYGSGSVNNSGLIEAASAELRAAGGNVYALAINNSGVVRASTVANEGGKIVLKADGGVTTSSGTLEAKGGEVQVLGAGVGLTGNAVVDVSGGGTALIGGDFQGKNPSVLNAQRTFVGPGASIRADDGTVVVWADGLTAYSGSISAKGGTVEVSGKESLLFNGSVDALNILLDPRDITIQATGANDSLLADSQILFAESTTATDVTISASVLTALTGNIILQADRDIIVNAALSLTQQTAGESVTFRAGDDLTINAAVHTSGASLTLNASDAGGSTPAAGTTTAVLTIGAPVGNATTGAIVFDNTGGAAAAIVLKDNVTSGSTVGFNQAVSMTGPSTVTGVGVTFSSTINGAQALTINDAGTTALNGSVGATTALTSLTTDATGTTALGASATTIATTGAQTFNDLVALGATTTFSSSSSGNISFDSVGNNVPRSLTVNTAGVTKFGGSVGAGTALLSVTTDAAGTSLLQGGTIRTTDSGTSGGQTYNDDVIIGADTTLTHVDVLAGKPFTFGKTVNADLAGNNRVLTLNNTGTNTFSGIVGGTQRLGTLTTDSGAAGLFIIGSSGISSKVQTYNRPVRISTSTTLTATDGSVTFNQPVNAAAANSQTLTINSGGATTFNNTVGATTALGGLTTDSSGSTAINANITSSAQAYNDPVTMGANLTLTSASTLALNGTVNGDIVDDRTLTLSAVGTTTIAGTVGGTAVLKNLTSNNGGTTAIIASSVHATTINISDATTIAAATTTLTGSAVILSGTVNGTAAGTKALVINANGLTTLAGVVGGTAALASISTDAPGTLTLSASVTTATTGTQTYREPVTLGGTPTLTATGASANVTFSSTINGTVVAVQGLTINAAGTTTIPSGVGAGADGVFGNADDKRLSTFGITSTTGTLALNGGVVNATTQTYSGPVTLGADTILSGTTVTFTATTGVVNATTAGGQSLAVNATTTTFGGAIGATTRLSTLTTDSTGTTSVRNVSTTGAQAYNDAVTLGAAATLDSSGSGNITLGSTLGGAFALIVNTSGTTTFTGAVSGVASVTTDAGTAGGTTVIAGVSTSGAQTYNDPLTIGTGATATTHTFASTSSGAINFASTINASGANKSLTVNTAGTTTFSGIVGGTNPLAAIATDNGTGSDTTVISATGVTTTGAQAYNDDVLLAASTTLTSSGSGAISFPLTINGAFNLTVNTSGATTFTGIVGGTTPPLDLTTDSGGTAVLAANITTVGAITFNDPVTLSANVALTSASDLAVTFGSTVNGAQTLTVNTGGVTSFNGAVGATTQLTSITTDDDASVATSAEQTKLGTTSIRATTQTYNDHVVLTASPTITGTTVTFASTGTVNSDATANNRQLTVNATTTTFAGNMGTPTTALGGLTTDSAGTTTFSTGNGFRAKTFTFNDAVVVSGPYAFGNSDYPATTGTFGSTISSPAASPQDVYFAVSGTLTFNSTIGAGAGPVNSVSVDPNEVVNGTTILKGNVTTMGGQNWFDQLVLGANVTLTGTAIVMNEVNADLASNNRTLTINGSALTTLAKAIGATAPLSSFITDAAGTLSIGGLSVTATTITLGDATTLTAATTLTGNNITLAGVNGAFNLTVSGTGTTTLNGDIGDTAALAELKFDNDGTTVIAANITTTGKLTFNDAITLSGGTGVTRTLNSGASDMTFNSTINGDPNLDARSTGATTFAGAVGGTTALESVTTNAGGTLVVSGGSIKTDAGQTYNETMILGANTTLTGTTPTFNATEVTGSGYDLTLNFSNNHNLDAGFSGIRHLSTGNGGQTDLQGAATISVTGRMTLNDAVTLNGGAITLQASDVTLAGTVNGAQNLTLTGTGATTISGIVGGTTPPTSFISNGGGSTQLAANVTANQLTLSADVLVLGADVTLSIAGTTTLGTVVGNGKQLQVTSGFMNVNGPVSGLAYFYLGISSTLTFDATGATDLTISTTGDQTYAGNMVLTDATTTFTSTGGGTINFPGAAGTLDGSAHDTAALTANTAGLTRFPAVVGATGRLASLTTDAAGSTLLEANITANTAITFNDAVRMGNNVTLTSQSNGAVTFASTVNGNNATDWNLIVTTSGATTFGGAVGTTFDLGNLTTSGGGTTAINGGTITVSGTQSYTAEASVTLGANTTLNGATLTLNLVPIIGNDTSDLTLNFTGTTAVVDATFSETIGQRIQNLTFGAGAALTTTMGTTTTTGAQTYHRPVTLNGATTLTTGGTANITFGAAATINGAFSLALNSSGTTAFGGNIGGAGRPTSITTDAGGTVHLNGIGSLLTDGAITFNDPVNLESATLTITTSDDNVTFGSTLNAINNAVNGALTIAQGTGSVTFTGAVGGTTPLRSLSVTGVGGGVNINGGQVTTLTAVVGNQGYVPAVTLGANTTLTGLSAGFSGGVNGTGSNYELTLNCSSLTSVESGFINLGKLTMTGPAFINGSVSLAGASQVMTFNGPVTFNIASTLTATDIYFGSSVSGSGAVNITLAATGTTTFKSTFLSAGTLTSNGGGTTVLHGNVNTIGAAQNYSADTVRLAADVTLTSSDATGVTLGAVQGTGDGTESLTITGNAVIGAGGVGTVAAKRLEALSVSGTTSLGASVTTTGNQTYAGVLTLTGASTLTGATPSFNTGAGGVTGAFNLTLDFSGTTAITGTAFTSLAALTTGGGGTTTLTGALTTTGAMTFNDAVQLVGNTTLDSAATALQFNSTLNSDSTGGRTLTIASTGTELFGGAVGGVVPLGALDTGTGAITINGGSINTGAANQTYDGAVTLGANTTLTGGTPAFNSTVAGGGLDLALNFTGTTTLTAAFSGMKNLTTGNGGGTTINGNISTTGTQTYNDAVTIAGGALTRTLTSSGTGSSGNITFSSTINANTANTESLSLNSSGTVTLAGAIGLGANGVFNDGGDDKPLFSLATDPGTAGGTTVSGGTIHVTNLVLNDTVTLGGGMVFKGTGIQIASPLATGALGVSDVAIFGGGYSLTLSSGATEIGGIVTGLSGLIVEGPTTFGFASATASTTSVTTSGLQYYAGALTLNKDTTLTGSTVTSATTSINSPGTTTITTKTLTVNTAP